MNSISQILKDIEMDDFKNESGYTMKAYYGENAYDISEFIGELERLVGRQVEENENLYEIIDAHLKEIASNIAKNSYSGDILFFIVYYFGDKLADALEFLTEKEYLEIANRDYDSFILSELIGCILWNLTGKDNELLVKLIDRLPFVHSVGIPLAFTTLISIKGLSETAMLKLREVIVRNGGVDWDKNVSICSDDGFILDLAMLIDDFNRYVTNGNYEVKPIDICAVKSDAKELLADICDLDDFDYL